ncbi:MAG: DUF1553 domain-containing protein [Planctomycetota bacterium]
MLTRSKRAALVLGTMMLLSDCLPAQPTQSDDLFRSEVYPLLEENCLKCHGGRRRVRGGLNLTTRQGILDGGFMGPAVDIEKPGDSLLLAMVSYRDEDHQMPPSGKMKDEDIAVLARWVEAGLPWNDDVAPRPETTEEPEAEHAAKDAMTGWSYRPLTRPEVPAVLDPSWATNPIDAFIYSKLSEADLSPVAPARPIAWLRRVTYDVTGLPPTPSEIEAFLKDESPGARRRVVDRLLDSPHYGEHWGRHWLDVVRYAETNGYERDSDKPEIWRYRDYVVSAFNQDKPYDQFVREQIAGDELEEVTPETLIASGYNRLMLWDDEPGEGALQGRYDVLADIVQTTGETFLGMTLGCARCHDHKADPITQKDFYRFMGFFHGLSDMRAEGTLVPIPTEEERVAYEEAKRKKESRLEELRTEVRAFEKDFLERLARQDDVQATQPDLVGLTYRFYRDTWSHLPDFDNLRFEEEGDLPSGRIDLSVATRRDAIGLVFEGSLMVPAAGMYRFEALAKDGIRLLVDGQKVLERDGVFDRAVKSDGSVTLGAGLVPLRLEYFNRDGEPEFELSWRAVPEPWRYTLERPDESWSGTGFDDSSWLRGQGGFGLTGTAGADVVTEWSSPDIWLRRDFTWKKGEELAWVFHHDERLEVFLNGKPVFERDGYITQYERAALSSEAERALVEGRNVLAVHCFNSGGGQAVDFAAVPLSELAQTDDLVDALRGRRFLSTRSIESSGDIAKLIQERGEGVFEKSELERYRRQRRSLRVMDRGEVPIPRAFAATERDEIPDLFVHIRGSANSPGDKVEPGFPSVLGDPDPVLPPRSEDATSSGRRRVLADWLTRPDHPLTSRVIMNRVWQYHFGRGIVPSSNDFGELGERPTHPELLDWLATELVAQGWSLKALHRQILLSKTYAMSSSFDADAFEKDPKNDKFWRFNPRRLGAEELRDSILALTGELNLAVGGPSFYEPLPAEVLATASRPDAAWGKSPESEVGRRSLYIKVKRSLAVPLLANFDAADTDASCPVRFQTTQPTQALNLLNGEFIHERAGVFAERLKREAGDDPKEQIRLAWHLATGRAPSDQELEENLAFRRELREEFELDEERVLELFCLMIFNLNEFVFLD